MLLANLSHTHVFGIANCAGGAKGEAIIIMLVLFFLLCISTVIGGISSIELYNFVSIY